LNFKKDVHKPEYNVGDVVILGFTSAISDYYGEHVQCESGDIAIILDLYTKKCYDNQIRWCCKFYVPVKDNIVELDGCPVVEKVLTKEEIGYWLYEIQGRGNSNI